MASADRFDPTALHRLLEDRYADIRRELREVMCREEFAQPVALPTAEYRQLVLEWAKTLAAEGQTAPGFPKEFGGRGDPGANVAFATAIEACDDDMLAEVRGQSGALVDAFGIPDQILAAPIALREATGAAAS